MQLEVDGKKYDIVVIKKKDTRSLYIRVKPDMKVYVTTSKWILDFVIKKEIQKNYDKIVKMIKRQETINKNNEGFYYLGKKYDVIYVDEGTVRLDGDKAYIKNGYDIDVWYKEQAKKIFQDRLDVLYKDFTRSIRQPSLRIRRMKTRWGVCNIKTGVITLNLKLIEREEKYLNYVIIHELSHLIHGNHSTRFWNLVEENYPDYKKVKREMNLF